MITAVQFRLFKSGSRTYFYSSLFFPRQIREDVFALYSFVRLADNYVDCQIPEVKKFKEFKQDFLKSVRTNTPSSNPVIADFVKLMKRKQISLSWVKAFLDAMESDLNHKPCKSLRDTESYMYGSAEVIGLMMAAILDLPKDSYATAKQLGKSMQYINFLRDVSEDNELQRGYIPQQLIKKAGLNSLQLSEVQRRPRQFQKLMRQEIDRYRLWQKEAEQGFSYLPKQYLVPIKTASDMYTWTAEQLYDQPERAFKYKVKPSVARVLTQLFTNYLTL